MGIWNFYFIAKLSLYFGHYIGFHVFANLAFALFLVIPVRHSRLKLARQIAAVPVGVALFYYDTWLPPFLRLISQASLLKGFDPAYLAELIGRFISFQVIAALALLYAIYFLAGKRLRISTFVFIAMLVPLSPVTTKSSGIGVAENRPSPGLPETATAKPSHSPTDDELTASLDSFYKNEATRTVSFMPPEKSDAPFDIIFLHICSLSWDDLDFTKEKNHPLFRRFDIVFTNFNSAASYSGPAAIRALRGNCGQPRHKDLYTASPAQCKTFDTLQQAGFKPQLAMNHDGHFDNFLAEIRKQGALNLPPFDVRGAPPYLQNFDGSPVHDDYTVLSKWWEKRLSTPSDRVALFYNSVSLHDGNRYSGSRSGNSMEIYPPRLTRLLSDLDHFFTQIETSGRRAIVVFIPEHGAAIRGDRMQIPGMREIPSPHISIVPVGIKLIGKTTASTEPLVVSAPASYLAVSELLSGFISQTPFTGGAPDLDRYVRNLTSTEFVAENEDVTVIRHDDRYFMRAQDTGWVEYASPK